MSTNSKKPYVVFTWKMANQLNEMGFRPIGKHLNFKDPTQEVILFEDTPELREAIKKINRKGDIAPNSTRR